MKRSTVLILAGLLAGFTASVTAGSLPKTKGWKVVSSASFTVYTNGSPGYAADLALELERLRGVLGMMTPEGTLTSPRPTTIYIFKSHRDFSPFKPVDEEGRARGDVAGYFLGRSDGNFMALVADRVEESGIDSILHEYIHFVLDHAMASVPAWFNEGAAQYYSTFASNGGALEVGRLKGSALAELNRAWSIPLEELFAVDFSSPLYRGGGPQTWAFYAEAWAVVHYFYHSGPQRLGQLQHFMRLVNRGVDQDRAFEASFKIPYAELQAEVIEHIKRKTLPLVRIRKEAVKIDESITTESVPGPVVLCRLGELLAHRGEGDHVPAEELFAAARERDRGLACAHRGLGSVARAEGQRDRAEEHFARAVELDPDDYLAHLYRGENLSQKVTDGHGSGGDAELGEADLELMERARAALRRATEIRPEWGEAWVELGRTWSMDERPPVEAVEALLRGLELMPHRDDVAISLADLYAAIGRPDGVDAAVTDGVRARLTDEGRALIDGYRERAMWNAAANLEDAGDRDGAAAQLEELLAEALDADTRSRAEQWLEELRPGG